MLVLGLDTSSPAVSAALTRVTEGGVELLAEGVRAVLRHGRPQAVVVGVGPGPFTGLRVGLVTAAAMSDGLGVPAYGVCSLDGLAGPGEDVVVVTDARRKEVYWARYEHGERVDGPHVSRPAEVGLPSGARVTGAGAQLHGDAFAGCDVDGTRLHPSVVRLVERAGSRALAGEPSDPLTPLYLRRPDAVEPGAVKRVTP